ncbi:MAG: hypothetical protein KAS39_04355, partial [Actinomycetia bacterium]|nr:hypothetical protein [Actinomycetes bacterium]
GLVADFNNIDYVYGYYRKDNKTPDQVFGDIVRAGDPEICREKEYGYILPEPSFPSIIEDKGNLDNLANSKCYVPPYLQRIPERSYRNDFFNTESYHASTHGGQYIGIKTERRSLPWLNASNLLNCDIWDIDETSKTVFSFSLFNTYGNIDHPILWNPIWRMNQKPKKVYMEWRIKMDERSFKYFNIKK